MKTKIKIIAMASVIAFGMAGGSTAARHIEHKVSQYLPKPTISVVEHTVPTFLVTVSTEGSGVVHVKADLKLSIDKDLVKDQECLDRVNAAALQATFQTFNGMDPNVIASSEVAASHIIRNINSLYGKTVVSGLNVKDLAVVKYDK